MLPPGELLNSDTDQLPQYLATGTILGATGGSRVSAAPRTDYAAAAAAALTRNEDGNAVYELGGTGFTFDELAAAVTEVTGTTVVHRDLPTAELASALRNVGLDADTAGFVAALDHSIAIGELFTDSDDLSRLIGRPTTGLRDAIRAARA